jgi:hypothetical protein
MSVPARDLSTLIDHAGFSRWAGAPTAAIGELEPVFGVELPTEFVEVWSLTDGATGDEINLLSLSEIKKYSGVWDGGFGYVPFTDCNDSNPYVVCCRAPLRGWVVHFYHDQESELVCRGFRRFFELVANARDNGEVDRLMGDVAVTSAGRTEDDWAIAGELMRVAGSMHEQDEWRGTALRFAAQLLGPGRERELATVLALGDEYTREAVRRRLTVLGTPEAGELLREDDAAYQRFVAEFKQGLEAVGLRTEPTRHGGFRVQPGNSHPNLKLLYVACRRPGAMAEWVQRFKERCGEE